MAEEMFLKIDGIQGESTDASHKDEINILSYTWGESLPAATARGSGTGWRSQSDHAGFSLCHAR
jgi:type VI secretion system secreted protein Hcp